MEIRKASGDGDIKQIAQLAEEIWHEFFPSIISAEQIDYMVEKYQSFDAIKSAVENDGYEYFMVYDGDKLCAYIGFHDEGNGTVFLSKIYVRSDMRGKGISAMMLDAVRRELPDAKKWYLTVNRHNTSAVKAYEKHGFTIAREQCADIGGGFVMDDYVMEKIL